MLSCQKDAFSLPPEVTFLNCAYMSPLSKRVEAAGIEAIRRKAVPSRIHPHDFFTESDRARALFAELIGCDAPTRVAIVPSASYGIATVAKNVSLDAAQNVVVLHEQFPSNVYAWRRLCARRGAAMRTVAPPDVREGRGRAWNQRLLEAIDARTAIVAVEQVHWTDGTWFDLEAVGARAREVGAAFVVDGTQSIGAMPFDLTRVQADAVVCAAYKWLTGPYAIGFAYYGPRFDEGEPLEETWIGREGSEDFQGLVNYRDAYQPGALRYDMGERSQLQLLPMAIAAMEQVLAWSPHGIQEYCGALTSELIAEAAALGFWSEDPQRRGRHLFGLRAPEGLDLALVADRLRDRQIHVSLRGSAIRVSPHLYNDGRDIEALLAVLAQVAAGAAR